MKKSNKLVLGIVLVLIAAGVAGVLFPGHGQELKTIYTPASLLNTNPMTTNLNVTIGRVAYITEPTEWKFSSSSPEPATFVNPTSSYTTNNSGYLFFINNATGTTAPSPEVVNFAVGSYLGTPSYFFLDSRVALNGTGETAYIVVSESAQTGAPSTTSNVLATSAGAAQNMIFVQFSPSSGNYAVTVGYYASVLGGNGHYYQNYTSYSFSSLLLNPLWFYDIYFNIQSTGTYISIVNDSGQILATSSELFPVIEGNYSKISYISYVHAPAASTSGDMFILDYAYIVDQNVNPLSAPLAGAITGMKPIIAPFDPNDTMANYTENPNATSSFTNTNISTTDFTSVLPSSSPAVETSSDLNISYLPEQNATTVYAANQTTALRASAENDVSVTADLYITSWTPQGINNAIVQYLQEYIGRQIGVMPSQITIISYLVTDMGFDMQFTNSTATSIRDFIYNSAPGIMQADGVSLVNTTTGAVVAGADIGDFMNVATGIIAQPIIKGNEIINPLTGAIYYSPQLAGFPVGSVVMQGSIYVPGQYQFYGFAADGYPVFASGWNPFAGLTGAAQAVSNFFHGAANTVTNAIGTVSKGVTQYVERGTSPSSTASFTSDLSKAVSGVMPFLGGAATNIAKSIVGIANHVTGGIGSGLASIRNTVTGALATGVNDIKNTFYHIGKYVTSIPNTGKNSLLNTIGRVRSAIGSVISPFTTGIGNIADRVKNGLAYLGNTIASAPSNIAKYLGGLAGDFGKGVLNTVGSTFTSAINGTIQAAANAFGNMTRGLISQITGALKSGSGTTISFFVGLSSTIGHYLVPIVIGGVLIVIVIAVLVVHGHGKKHHHSHRKKR